MERRLLRIRARAERALATAVVVVPAKVLLSTGDVLRNDQVSFDGVSRRGCGLGQAGKKSDRGSAAVVWQIKSKNVIVLPEIYTAPKTVAVMTVRSIRRKLIALFVLLAAAVGF